MTAVVTGPARAVADGSGGVPVGAPVRVRQPRAEVRRTPLRAGVDVVCLLAVLALALAPLVAVHGGADAVPALVGGLLLGIAVAVASAVWRWSAVATVAALVVGYAVAGGPLAAPSTTDGLVPTRETAQALLTGPAAAWKQVLTLQPPVGSSGSLLVAAFLLALVGSAASVVVALRAAPPSLAASAALVPVAVMAVVVVLGTRRPSVPPVVTGTVLGVVLLVWAAARSGGLRARRLVAVGVLLAVAVGAAVLGGPVVVGGTPRHVVRDEIVPPFDPRDYPSPLSAFRAFVKQDDDTALFTVEGLPAGARVRLATMDRYDGVVWDVAGDGAAESSGEFRRVGESLDPGVRGTEARVHVTIGALRGVWLPTVGRARSIRVHGASAAAGLRYNDATGGAVLTGGVHEGQTFDADVVVPRVPADDELGAAAAADVVQPPVVGAPDAVAVTAADVARDAGSPVEIARALTRWLSEEGYFSHGVVEAGDYPSLSGHGADRITSLLGGDVMVGDGEQYASALALLAREMGLPARVVLGFVPDAAGAPGPVPVTGRDVQAWVEIAFAGHGWVPFDPTPPTSQTPQESDEQTPSDPDPQVVQPPPAPPAAAVPPDEDTEQPRNDAEADRADSEPGWYAVARVAGAASVPVVLLAVPFVVVAVLRARRRYRRRRRRDTVTRVAAGWDEVVDTALDLRRPVPHAATRLESARELAAAFAGARPERAAAVRTAVHDLARSADRAVFGPGDPDDATARAFWSRVDATRAEMWRSVRWRTRWRARLSTASLRFRRARRRPGGGSPGGGSPGGGSRAAGRRAS